MHEQIQLELCSFINPFLKEIMGGGGGGGGGREKTKSIMNRIFEKGGKYYEAKLSLTCQVYLFT